jgi:hypothetical protein
MSAPDGEVRARLVDLSDAEGNLADVATTMSRD